LRPTAPVNVSMPSYDADSVHDGAGAIEAWKRLTETNDIGEREALRGALLAYCKLDTLAMVEIYRFLIAIISRSD